MSSQEKTFIRFEPCHIILRLYEGRKIEAELIPPRWDKLSNAKVRLLASMIGELNYEAQAEMKKRGLMMPATRILED